MARWSWVGCLSRATSRLPVVCVSNARRNSTAATDVPRFEYAYSKYSGWPEVKESLMSGRISAAYMLAPLVMDLADRKIPVKIVSLGHRSGAVIMVRTESPYQQFRQLRGKQIAIPSRFAVDFLFLRKMLAREGMTPRDIQVVEMPPPDMPAALYANAVDAYCTGEPFGAAAQRAGYARPLRMTRDEWRNYICCVLTVREELIAELARALVVKPEILYMDEPFAALDALMNLRMRTELLRILAKERHTVVMVTHDVEEATHIADRILVLSPRPTRIQATFEVSLRHPRVLTGPEIQKLRVAILRELGVDTFLE